MNVLGRPVGDNRLIRLVLAVALVLAALHVSLHDLNASGDAQTDCQVCRLVHIPGVDLPAPPLILPLPKVVAVNEVPQTRPISRNAFGSWRARAPPLR